MMLSKKVICVRLILCSVFLVLNSNLSWTISYMPWATSSSSPDKTSFIEAIAQYEDPNEAQKIIRMYAAGGLKACLDLYKQAKEKDNSVARIYIANAYSAIIWGKDSTKNFNKIKAQDLEGYLCAIPAMYLLHKIEGKIEPTSISQERDPIIKDIFEKAVDQGNIFAQMARILKIHRDLNFASACRLKPLTKRSHMPELLYYYGLSLF